jgi:flagellar motor switch protein FliN
MTDALVEAFAARIAEACARRLGATSVGALRADEISIARAGDDLLATREFPLVAVALPYEGASAGESTVLLEVEGARALAALLDPELDELGEPALDALSSAVAGLLEGGAAALTAELGIAVTLGSPTVRLVADAGELRPLDPEAWALSYHLQGDALSLSLLQTLPASLGDELAAPAIDAMPAIAIDDADTAGLRAVEQVARISADAAVEVFSALFSEQLVASSPSVALSDTLEDRTYPMVIGDVSYVGGLQGSTRFCLQPQDVALLAAAMMGTPETTGDGLSAIELSAVSEALNQMLGTTAQALAARLGFAVEISPPSCVVVDSAEQARAHIGETAYRASFAFESVVFGAEISQEISPELAASLEEAFASTGDDDDGFSIADLGDAFAGALLEGEPENPEAGRAGAREILSGIRVRVSAELGRAKLPIARVANLPDGAVVMLDRAPTDPVDVLVNGTPFAQARVVLVDGEYAVQIVSLSPFEHAG